MRKEGKEAREEKLKGGRGEKNTNAKFPGISGLRSEEGGLAANQTSPISLTWADQVAVGKSLHLPLIRSLLRIFPCMAVVKEAMPGGLELVVEKRVAEVGLGGRQKRKQTSFSP